MNGSSSSSSSSIHQPGEGEDRLAALPNELLGVIWGHLDARSRAALWATCRAVPEAEDVSRQVGPPPRAGGNLHGRCMCVCARMHGWDVWGCVEMRGAPLALLGRMH